MARLDVQGIVARADGLPQVQFRYVDDAGAIVRSWMQPVEDARECAQQIIEAAQNAVCDAAMIDYFGKEVGLPDEKVGAIVTGLRDHRQDSWGLKGAPEDWRSKGGNGAEA